eukprot:1150190-Pelagomonas_calceolata.AAC.13
METQSLHCDVFLLTPSSAAAAAAADDDDDDDDDENDNAQAQVLMETLRQAEIGAQPVQALQLAAALAAAFHATTMGLKARMREGYPWAQTSLYLAAFPWGVRNRKKAVLERVTLQRLNRLLYKPAKPCTHLLRKKCTAPVSSMDKKHTEVEQGQEGPQNQLIQMKEASANLVAYTQGWHAG